MARKGAKKSLPPSCSQSSLLSAHKWRKFRAGTGCPSTSTSMVWRPEMPTTSTMVWRPKVPASWEIKYCQEEGSIPWKRIAKTQSLMKSWVLDDEFKRCWDWDASSGKEALEKAKAWYWRKLNGFPFESLTNEESADMYNDTDIDWNPEIDPEISLALDRGYMNDASINEGGNDWFAHDYLPNKDEKVIEGWGSD
ncbi:hypothetical protein C5167_011635 [Papaver somniferum]|uniref:Uncharacterized protein n=1 Tax=Papaver somniferum TaxID=3469 RepID=A0A4Y7K547_PAPSO|nr:uncharacterized protein LOC113286468 [Papaver somniferum]RZC67946.1 hypothetical protein C5167_011635 [Papaver somniferum]